MLGELVNFVLSCTLPSSTPIIIERPGPVIRTCQQILSSDPPMKERLPGRQYKCNLVGKRTVCSMNPVKLYPSWQAYCDEQTDRPCRYPNSYNTLRADEILSPNKNPGVIHDWRTYYWNENRILR